MSTHTHTFPEDGANCTHYYWPLTSQSDPVPRLQWPPAGPRATAFTSTKYPLSSLTMGRAAHKDRRSELENEGHDKQVRKRVRKGGRRKRVNLYESSQLSRLGAVYLADWVKHKPLITLHIPDNITVTPALRIQTYALYQRPAWLIQTHRLFLLT